MILQIDTSTPTCFVWLDGDGGEFEYSWEAGRELSKGIFTFLEDCLKSSGADWSGVSGVVVYRGPGSFTGLRIGATVMNTIASARNLPIVGETGDYWRKSGLARIKAGESDQIVLPEYGSDANITTPRK